MVGKCLAQGYVDADLMGRAAQNPHQTQRKDVARYCCRAGPTFFWVNAGFNVNNVTNVNNIQFLQYLL